MISLDSKCLKKYTNYCAEKDSYLIRTKPKRNIMEPPIRHAVRVLLLNNNKLLLMCFEDFDISTPDGTKNKRFWCTIGGGIEGSESIEEAAYREIYEETGIMPKDVELGPIVWKNTIDLVLKGTLTRLKEQFVVAKTSQQNVFLQNPTLDESKCVKKLNWFSLKDIQASTEIIFPKNIAQHLPSIFSNKYPSNPIEL